MAMNWDDYAEDWEASPATVDFTTKAFESLTAILDLSGKRMLDFGCGTGLLCQKMSPLAKDIVALDGSEAMIEQLDGKELSNVEPVVDMLSRGLVAIHPAFRGQFDIITASSVCGYLSNYADIADVIYSLIEEGGYFIQWDWHSDDPNAEEGMASSRAEQVLTSVGFTEVKVSIPFAVDAGFGPHQVVMCVAKK